MEELTNPHARLTEFVRQARRLRGVDPTRIYTINTDVDAADAPLSLDDLDALLTAMDALTGGTPAARPEPADDEHEQLMERIVSSIRGRDGEAGAGSDATVGGGLSHVFGPGYDYLEINGNLDIQHLASDLLQDGYGQHVPDLYDAWEAGADAMVGYIEYQHTGADAPRNPYDRNPA